MNDMKKASDQNCTNCKYEEYEHDVSPCVDCVRGSGDDDMWQAKEVMTEPDPAANTEESPIKDSGGRREFDTGAVRDIAEGKGRCDLLPMDVVASWMNNVVLREIASFVQTHSVNCLHSSLTYFCSHRYRERADMLLELAKHFEDGAKKYGEYNWQKGLPVHCYIDSAVRHYLKWLRGDNDEPHDRAFVWNIVCCIWTMTHKPEMDDLPKAEVSDESISD